MINPRGLSPNLRNRGLYWGVKKREGIIRVFEDIRRWNEAYADPNKPLPPIPPPNISRLLQMEALREARMEVAREKLYGLPPLPKGKITEEELEDEVQKLREKFFPEGEEIQSVPTHLVRL